MPRVQQISNVHGELQLAAAGARVAVHLAAALQPERRGARARRPGRRARGVPAHGEVMIYRLGSWNKE